MTDEPTGEESGTGRKPPYPGFGAFTSLIDRMAKTSVPAVVDRHFIGGSGTNQSLMTGALTYLGLIDLDSRPTGLLHRLVEQEDVRPEIYRFLVEANYGGALQLGLRATQSQLDAWFRAQGVSGETARKAQSFFLALAKAGEIEVSPHFKVTRASPSARKKVPFKRRILPPENPVARVQDDVPPPAETRQIHATVTALLDKIPAPGETWTQEEKDLLVTTFSNLLDLFHPVTNDQREYSGKRLRPLEKEDPST